MASAVVRGWLGVMTVAALGCSAVGQVEMVSHAGGTCQEYPSTGAFDGKSYCAGVGLAGTRVFVFDGASARSSSFSARDAALHAWLGPIEMASAALGGADCVETFRLLACYAWYVRFAIHWLVKRQAGVVERLVTRQAGAVELSPCRAAESNLLAMELRFAVRLVFFYVYCLTSLPRSP